MKTQLMKRLTLSTSVLTLIALPCLAENGNVLPDTNVWGQVNIWTGAKFNNPYKINTDTRKLESAGDKTDGYLEISVSTRYVLRQGKEVMDPVLTNSTNFYKKLHINPTQTPNDGAIHFVNPFTHMPDIDARIGYLFRDKPAPTNYDAATVVGSSDFYFDGSLGLPLLRYCSQNEKWKQQVTLELNGGFATDKDCLDIHPNAFLGLGWQSSFMVVSNRQGYWIGRAGYAMIDQPALNQETGLVQFTGLDLPKFDEKFVPSLGALVVYPIFDNLSLQASINAYFTDETPASWNASLGVSMNLEVIGKFFSTITK